MYCYVPKAPELAHLRDDDVYPNINRADYARTIYPPVAQMVFLAATRFSDSVIWMKLFITLFDVASFWLILKLISFAGLRRERFDSLCMASSDYLGVRGQWPCGCSDDFLPRTRLWRAAIKSEK